MKKFIWVSLLFAMGCRDKSDVIISLTPDQLIGTWKDTSPKIQLGKRLTFTHTQAYTAIDSLASCQPVEPNKALRYRYTINKGAIVLTYDGITIGMDAPGSERLSVVSFDSTHLVIRTPLKERIEFEKCK
ncbi:hypothetical protein C5O19_24355 [Siphonobacter curvatus]|uniref:Lipocalin-like domain-containing protein n=1 Tax=Siphonobacter curvatus TaxID=2094562 RepID=A0A2S7IEY2_9BACT|nr:hypothetical protein C5O19_24355 [Siphonobacter curvatus]